ncbi:RHS repeat-associated core domain-containing protein [Pseudoalteromonas sp. DL2-H2.2]|uniref:RHS repeat domain-containing protein n=1 Tax=Pseudoalteromonas sp. DL2-H2.2 TaxID=2908889 RepID=UPI001F2BB7A3|nr:RHS repeat-associated core domain-containing protein [Pseudoalteromonas sp. DL2-H2.2]MCF2910373.1 RHS repeat-associated core domain-containing protein [Pseudoalteromonas sp. DL2-H2.2]
MELLKSRLYCCLSALVVFNSAYAMEASEYQGEKINYLKVDDQNQYGEKIDLQSGRLSYEVVDAVIPGNPGLDIVLSRSFDDSERVWGNNGQVANMSNWRLEIPRIIIPTVPFGIVRGWDPTGPLYGMGDTPYIYDFDTAEYDKYIKHTSTTRQGICKDPYPGDGRASWLNSGGDKIAKKYWSGMRLKIPGQPAQQLFKNTDTTRYPTAKWVTTHNWVASCTNDGNGFIVKSPQGVTYTIDKVQALSAFPSYLSSSFAHTGTVTMLASEKSNVHGESVQYVYEVFNFSKMPRNDIGAMASHFNVPYIEQRLVQILRENETPIRINYDTSLETIPGTPNPDGTPGDDIVVTSATGWERIKNISMGEGDYDFYTHKTFIRYDYEKSSQDGRHYLTSVKTGGKKWGYKYGEGTIDDKKAYFDIESQSAAFNYYGPRLLTQVTLPSGGTISYDYKVFDKLRRDPYSENIKLHKKTVNNGTADIDVLTFDYADTSYDKEDAIEVTITNADETIKKTFSDDKSFQHGQLLEEVITDTSSSKTKKTKFEYKQIANIGDFKFLDFPEDIPESLTSLVAVKKKTITLDGKDYVTEYLQHNIYGYPTKIKETFSGNNKYTKLGYYNHTGNWILGLPTYVEVSDTDTSDKYEKVTEVVYHDETTQDGDYVGLGLPYEHKKFGTWVTRYTEYTAKGNLAKEEYNAARAVGTGNRFTQYLNYKRGTPGTITVPSLESDSTISRTQEVDEFGKIVKATDFNGTETRYKYKYGNGYLVSIALESDAVHGQWLGTLVEWDDKHQTRTISRCTLNSYRDECTDEATFKTVETYDGLTRLITTASHDTSENSTISRYQKFGYNKNNQLTFESYKADTLDGISGGISTYYDSFGRKTSEVATGRGTVQYDYLEGNKIRFTDAGKNENNETHSTTTTYLAYGAPDYSIATKIESPEGVTTDIDVDVFGITKTISQTGSKKDNTTHTITETRLYTSSKHLCLLKRPELGTTIYGRNNLGELTWSKSGVEDAECTTTKPSQAIAYSYDNQGNLDKVDYADNSGDVEYTRDNNGNVTTLKAGDVTHTYNYNNQGLLEDETVTVGTNLSLQTDYEYNALLHRSYTTYPDFTGLTISHKPNGFGEPTEARVYNELGEVELDFAQNASYHANGLLKSFTYGNGVTHSMELHPSQQPKSLIDSVNSADVVNLKYTYDNNSNVTSITNAVDPGYSLSKLTYDGLNRLKETTGGTKAGSSSMSYDGFGNITKYTSLNRNLDYTYDYTKNRLTSVSGVSGKYSKFDYDSKGNITHNGLFSLTFNQAGRIAAARGFSYKYDGHHRRVYQSDNGGSYSVYTQDGTLIYREKGTSIEGNGTSYIYLGSKLIAKYGDVELNTDPEAMQHRPYGETIGEASDDIGYTGHKFDTALDLSYMQARYYDPVIGRFYSNDPVEYTASNPVMSFNRYLYVNNNPYKYTDPNGEFLNFAVKFVADVAMGAAINYATTGSVNLGGAIKESAQGILNPAKSIAKGQKLLKLYRGGAHGKVRGVKGNESHHMPADSVSPLSKNKGPAISMDKADHRQTASWGNSKEAKAYRAQQKQLIDNGQFKEAQQMDVNDVQSKFGTKYDSAIREMQDYTDKLDK